MLHLRLPVRPGLALDAASAKAVRMAADILDQDPDLVTVQAVTASNRAVMDARAADYPARAWRPFAAVGGWGGATR